MEREGAGGGDAGEGAGAGGAAPGAALRPGRPLPLRVREAGPRRLPRLAHPRLPLLQARQRPPLGFNVFAARLAFAFPDQETSPRGFVLGCGWLLVVSLVVTVSLTHGAGEAQVYRSLPRHDMP